MESVGVGVKLYLAGGVNGLYIAGDMSIIKNDQSVNEGIGRVNLLESFYYIRDWQYPMISRCKSFMLDSGAFSFLQSKKGANWVEYVDRFADFVVEHNIHLFFELDIDPIIGYKQVIALRNRLEARTGRQCIPVWHKSRGKQAFVDMCRDYEYVSIGGIVTREITRREYKVFNPLCDIAHEHGAKIHGLGFTNTDLATYHFDSVDSTGWIYGNRSGFLFQFDGSIMTKIHRPAGHRLKAREVAVHNFWEWVKMGEYLETNVYLAGQSSRRFVL